MIWPNKKLFKIIQLSQLFLFIEKAKKLSNQIIKPNDFMINKYPNLNIEFLFDSTIE